MRIKYTIVCLMALIGTANAQYQNYVLKDPDSNTDSHTYVGRDYVRLTNGYKFTAVQGKTMNAKVKSGLSTDDANNFVAIAIPTPGGSSDAVTTIDKTKAVGQIPISSSVSPSGAKCYNVPIEIVPGRQGFQPNISLSYNSQAGNGLVGVGWSISGLSSIERVNKNMFFDGKNDIPALSGDDAFTLDGVRLIKNETTSTDTQYNYETVTGNTRVIAYVNGDIVKFFKVFYPNGTIGIMGYTDNTVSKLSYPVTTLTDMNGSVITFSYTLDTTDLNAESTNETYYINEINYGKCSSILDFAKLKFRYYSTRPDVMVGFQSTKSEIVRNLLYKIESFVNTDSVRCYQFEYSNADPKTPTIVNDVSRLIQINSTANRERINPLKFYYGENISPSVSSTPANFTNANFNLNEVNAVRGKFDVNPQNDALLVFPKKEAYTPKAANGTYTTNYLNNELIKVYQNVKDGSSIPCPIIINGSDSPFTTGDGFEDVFSANVDGKGQDEIVKVNMRFDEVNNSDYEYLTFNVFGVNSNKKLQLLNSYDYQLGSLIYPNGMDYSVTPWKFYTGNFSGHGKTEVVALSKDNDIRNKALLIDLDGGGRNLFTQANIINTNDIVYPMDIDGDGQTEIVCVKASQTVLYKYVDNISGFQSVGSWALTTTDFNERNARQILFADLNGDGNIDIIFSPKAQHNDTIITCPQKSLVRTGPSPNLWVNQPYMECPNPNCQYPILRCYREPGTWNVHYLQTVRYLGGGINGCQTMGDYNFPDDSGLWDMVTKFNSAPLTYPMHPITGCNYPIIENGNGVTYCHGCGGKVTYPIPEWDFSRCWKCGAELAHNNPFPSCNLTDFCSSSAHPFLSFTSQLDYSGWSRTVNTPNIYQYPSITTKDWIYKYTNGRSIVRTETDNNGITRVNTQKFSIHEVNGDDVPDLIIQDTSNGNISILPYDSKIRFFKNSYISTTNNPTPAGSELLDYDLNSGHSYSAILALGSNKLTSCEFPFNHTRSTTISLMVNSLGVADKTDYSQLSQGTTYTMGSSAVFPYTDYSGSFWVTAQTKAMYNKQMIGNAIYSYSGAIVHTQGLGLIGFSSMVSTDLMKNKTVTTEYDPKHSGVVTHQTSPEIESSFDYTFIDYDRTLDIPILKMKLLLTNKTETDKLKGNTITVTYSGYDDYGNVGTVLTDFGGNIKSTVSYSYYNRLDDPDLIGALYLIGFPGDQSTTFERNNQTFSRKESYVYNNFGRPQYYRNYIGSKLITETEYVYFPYPYNYNIEYQTVHNKITNASADDLITSYTYWDDKCSLKTKTDPFGLATNYSYYSDPEYPNIRLLRDVTDYLGNKVTYGYDNWRRKNSEVSTVGTDVITTSISLNWNTESEPKRLIKEKVTITNQPETNTYTDAFGRETRKTILGFDGTLVFTDKEYDNFGHLQSSTAPYKTNPLCTTYRYDEFDRPTSVVQPNGSTRAYTYAGNKISENKDGVITSKTTDATGKLISSTDGGGEVIYTYRADGQPDNVNTEGVITSFKYDDPYNRQTKLIDPSAGTVQTAYDDANHKVTQTWNSGKVITTVSNKYGQPTSKTTPDFTTSYNYDNKGRPTGSTSTNGTSKAIEYDTYGRLWKSSETVNAKSYQEVYGYDNGRIGSVTYNTGTGTTLSNLATVQYKYNGNGYLYKLVDGANHVLRQVNSVNELGQETNVSLGNGLTTTKNYTPEGLLTSIQTGTIQNMSYNFNRINGTLNSRSDIAHGLSESFSYDNLYRLKNYGSNTMNYAPNGNITNKPEVGAYTYPDVSKPYTLGSVNTGSDLKNELDVTYTVLSRQTSINNVTGLAATFTYNDDYDRATMQIKQGTTETLSKIYFFGGKYEIETVGGVDKQRLYVDGSPYDASVLMEKAGSNAAQTYYLHRDYLGSITQITDNSANLAAEYSYDAWGRLRNPVDWTPYTQSQLQQYSMPYGGRGYTGHEQLNQFGIINMNARLYDPLLGRFLAPDPQVANPLETNGFNRYAYASNNPLLYVDFSGEEFNLWQWLFPKQNNTGNNYYYYNNGNNNSGNTGSGFNLGNTVTGPSAGGGYPDYNSGFSGNTGGGMPEGSLSGIPGLVLYGIDLLFGNHNPDPRFLPHNVTYTAAVIQGANAKPINLPKPVGTGVSSVYSGGGRNLRAVTKNTLVETNLNGGVPVYKFVAPQSYGSWGTTGSDGLIHIGCMSCHNPYIGAYYSAAYNSQERLGGQLISTLVMLSSGFIGNGGSEEGLSAIGPRATYRQYAKKIGANYLNVTDEEWTFCKNYNFIKGAAERGDKIAFPGKFNSLELDRGSMLGWEIRYFENNGYVWNSNFTKLIKK